jgi:hypothetical protein
MLSVTVMVPALFRAPPSPAAAVLFQKVLS